MLQWITALEKVATTSHYYGRNRFDSFVPIRLNVSAQWLVDGVSLIGEDQIYISLTGAQRDYMWNLSRALLLARETILIHDWWLSPGEILQLSCHQGNLPIRNVELQLRRPNKARYRLDRLLEKKAKEGVKIYIIL
jgi:phospholipase D1/2